MIVCKQTKNKTISYSPLLKAYPDRLTSTRGDSPCTSPSTPSRCRGPPEKGASATSADRRSRAYGLFYTISIGASSLGPTLYGFIGDAFGAWTASKLIS